MINYETANLKELFDELKKTKNELQEGLEIINATYEKTLDKTKEDSRALELLRYYYKSHSVNKVLTSARDIIKVIDNLLLDPKVSQHYIDQLKSISEVERRDSLGDFKEDWLKTIGSEDYANLYVQACNIDDWIDDCKNIAHGLNNFISENNPISKQIEVSSSPEHICEIRNGNQIFIDGTYSKTDLTPALLVLLKKLLKVDSDGHYEVVKTKYLKIGVGSRDAFRTRLRRLREETSKLFSIKPDRTLDNNRGYKVVFTD